MIPYLQASATPMLIHPPAILGGTTVNTYFWWVNGLGVAPKVGGKPLLNVHNDPGGDCYRPEGYQRCTGSDVNPCSLSWKLKMNPSMSRFVGVETPVFPST